MSTTQLHESMLKHVNIFDVLGLQPWDANVNASKFTEQCTFLSFIIHSDMLQYEMVCKALCWPTQTVIQTVINDIRNELSDAKDANRLVEEWGKQYQTIHRATWNPEVLKGISRDLEYLKKDEKELRARVRKLKTASNGWAKNRPVSWIGGWTRPTKAQALADPYLRMRETINELVLSAEVHRTKGTKPVLCRSVSSTKENLVPLLKLEFNRSNVKLTTRGKLRSDIVRAYIEEGFLKRLDPSCQLQKVEAQEIEETSFGHPMPVLGKVDLGFRFLGQDTRRKAFFHVVPDVESRKHSVLLGSHMMRRWELYDYAHSNPGGLTLATEP